MRGVNLDMVAAKDKNGKKLIVGKDLFFDLPEDREQENLYVLCESVHEMALNHRGPHDDRFRIELGPSTKRGRR